MVDFCIPQSQPLLMLFCVQDEEDFVQMMVSAGTNSKLDPAIQSLVKMIFDVDSMKQTLLEFEVDFLFLFFVYVSLCCSD